MYLRQAEPLLRRVRSLVGDQGVAEDIVHDTLVKAIESGQPPSPSWLHAVARNGALDHLRRQRRVQLEEPRALSARRETHLDGLPWGTSGRIHAALGRLPRNQRHVLVLRFAYAMTPAETAAVVGKSNAAVRQLECRGLGALRTALGDPAALVVAG
jgi:RNA polymerase sigma-70 factor (ECF subfamily)